ncbi:MAG: hypothetical protein WD342_01905 [Verrucomicrobiales bacterium]
MKNRFLLTLALTAVGSVASTSPAAEPVAIGDRLELFGDEHLVESISGDVRRHVHRPEPREVVFVADAPWEGNTSGYYSVFRDEDLVRLVYRGWAHEVGGKKRALRPEVTCLANSADGLQFERPVLEKHEWEGSLKNNIILKGKATHNFAAFVDTNPDCPPEARYKGIGGQKSEGGLFVYASPDCVNWEKLEDSPVITDGAFDSQNIAFWDSTREEYRAYYRIFSGGGTEGGEWKPKGKRAIRTAVSKDFVTWEKGVDVTYPEGTPDQHLYTNAIEPYFRAPHLFVGFPTRYLPDEGQRVEPVFMMGRDGERFTRFDKAVIPESAPADRAGNRSNYMAWGMVTLPEHPDEISVYATEAYYGPVPGRVRRFVYRLDGFVSLRADADGGEAVTRPLEWKGDTLTLNYAGRSGNSSLRVELQDAAGAALPGFALDDAVPLTGDNTAATVEWKGGASLESLGDQPVRIRFVLRDADLYSLRFGG